MPHAAKETRDWEGPERMSHTAAVWFRNDLRLDDHEPLVEALRTKPSSLVCFYVLDPFWFGTTREFQFPKTGAFRARFLFEALADLRARLRQVGQELLILRGGSAEVIRNLCKEHRVGRLYYHAEATSEEIAIEDEVDRQLSEIGVQSSRYWGATLYHRDDLPFAVKNLPPVFTQFRLACEKNAKIRPPLAAPRAFSASA